MGHARALLVGDVSSLLLKGGLSIGLATTGVLLNLYWYLFLRVSKYTTDYRYGILEKLEAEMESRVGLFTREAIRVHEVDPTAGIGFGRIMTLFQLLFIFMFIFSLILVVAIASGQLGGA